MELYSHFIQRWFFSSSVNHTTKALHNQQQLSQTHQQVTTNTAVTNKLLSTSFRSSNCGAMNCGVFFCVYGVVEFGFHDNDH